MRHIISKNHKVERKYPIDTLALIVGTIQPLATIPQILLVYKSHNAAQVSLGMWIAFDLASVVLLLYGVKHQLLPIIVAQAAWLIVQTIMIIGVIKY